MKIENEELKPILIKDKELLEVIDRIYKERNSITKLILDMANARYEVSEKTHKWFVKVIKKYNIPKEYEDKLIYNHEKHEITFS